MGKSQIYELTKEDFEAISRIFFPNDNYKIPFTSKWEHTRENVGYYIHIQKFPVSFSHEKYFKYHKYLLNRAMTQLSLWRKFKLFIKGELPRLDLKLE